MYSKQSAGMPRTPAGRQVQVQQHDPENSRCGSRCWRYHISQMPAVGEWTGGWVGGGWVGITQVCTPPHPYPQSLLTLWPAWELVFGYSAALGLGQTGARCEAAACLDACHACTAMGPRITMHHPPSHPLHLHYPPQHTHSLHLNFTVRPSIPLCWTVGPVLGLAGLCVKG